MAQTQSNRAGETQERPRRHRAPVLMNALCGVALAVLVCLAVAVMLDSLMARRATLMEWLGLARISEAFVGLLIIAVVIVALYTLHPLLGSIVALMVVFPVLALHHFVLAVLYVVCAVFVWPCLGKCGIIFLFVLAALAAEYPVLAMFLPCLPVVIGLVYGRGTAWYVVGVLAVVVLVSGLVAGRAAMGVVYIGGNEQPLMESEGITVVRDIAFPPDADEMLIFYSREFGGGWLGAVWVLLSAFLGGLGGIWALGAYLVIAEVLLPRLLPLLPQVLLWAIVGEATAWAVWALRRKAKALWISIVVLGSVLLTIAGHAALSNLQ